MKKTLIVVFCAAFSAAVSFAAPATCGGVGPWADGTLVNSGGFGATAATSNNCTNGPLFFSNFTMQIVAGTPSPGVTFAQGAQPSNVGSDYFLYLSPNLAANQDIRLEFMVSGALIFQVSMNNSGGQNSTINEHVCDAAGVSNGGNCLGVQLGSLNAADGQNVSENITATSTVWIWKDILTQSGGHNSGFSQDFLVPEPATLLLIGGGLSLLGLVRRRKKA